MTQRKRRPKKQDITRRRRKVTKKRVNISVKRGGTKPVLQKNLHNTNIEFQNFFRELPKKKMKEWTNLDIFISLRKYLEDKDITHENSLFSEDKINDYDGLYEHYLDVNTNSTGFMDRKDHSKAFKYCEVLNKYLRTTAMDTHNNIKKNFIDNEYYSFVKDFINVLKSMQLKINFYDIKKHKSILDIKTSKLIEALDYLKVIESERVNFINHIREYIKTDNHIRTHHFTSYLKSVLDLMSEYKPGYKKYVALYDRNDADDVEYLNFNQGNLFEFIDYSTGDGLSNKEWYYVKKIDTGKEGLVPHNFVQEITNES